MKSFIVREPIAAAIMTVMAISIIILVSIIAYEEYSNLDDWKVLDKTYKGPYTTSVNVTHNNIQTPYLVRHPEAFTLLLVNERTGEVKFKYVKKERFERVKINEFIKMKVK